MFKYSHSALFIDSSVVGTERRTESINTAGCGTETRHNVMQRDLDTGTGILDEADIFTRAILLILEDLIDAINLAAWHLRRFAFAKRLVAIERSRPMGNRGVYCGTI